MAKYIQVGDTSKIYKSIGEVILARRMEADIVLSRHWGNKKVSTGEVWE